MFLTAIKGLFLSVGVFVVGWYVFGALVLLKNRIEDKFND